MPPEDLAVTVQETAPATTGTDGTAATVAADPQTKADTTATGVSDTSLAADGGKDGVKADVKVNDNPDASLTDKPGEAAKTDENTQTKSDEKKDEAKTDDKAGLDLKVPDGVTLDKDAVAAFTSTLRDSKLTEAEKAQKLVDLHIADMQKMQTANAEAVKQAEAKAYERYRQMKAGWIKDAKADSEFGGANFEAKIATMAQAIDNVMSKPGEAKAFRYAMTMTGAGNHPAVIRFLTRVAPFFSEGVPVAAGRAVNVNAKGGLQGKSAANTFYPDMN